MHCPVTICGITEYKCHQPLNDECASEKLISSKSNFLNPHAPSLDSAAVKSWVKSNYHTQNTYMGDASMLQIGYIRLCYSNSVNYLYTSRNNEALLYNEMEVARFDGQYLGKELLYMYVNGGALHVWDSVTCVMPMCSDGFHLENY